MGNSVTRDDESSTDTTSKGNMATLAPHNADSKTSIVVSSNIGRGVDQNYKRNLAIFGKKQEEEEERGEEIRED